MNTSTMSNKIITSFYIPRISTAHLNEQFVRQEFERMGVGLVERIDFFPVAKFDFQDFRDVSTGPGSYVSAKIHCYLVFPIGNEQFFHKIQHDNGYRHYLSSGNGYYWIIKKANKTIKTTFLNNTQIVENCRTLQKTVDLQSETIASLREELDTVKDVMSQLISGLFCHETQPITIHQYLHKLYPNKFSAVSRHQEPNTSEWDTPTTRQGDNCEYRIDFLERKYEELRVKLDDDTASSSTHSSMPPLMDENGCYLD